MFETFFTKILIVIFNYVYIQQYKNTIEIKTWSQ